MRGGLSVGASLRLLRALRRPPRSVQQLQALPERHRRRLRAVAARVEKTAECRRAALAPRCEGGPAPSRRRMRPVCRGVAAAARAAVYTAEADLLVSHPKDGTLHVCAPHTPRLNTGLVTGGLAPGYFVCAGHPSTSFQTRTVHNTPQHSAGHFLSADGAAACVPPGVADDGRSGSAQHPRHMRRRPLTAAGRLSAQLPQAGASTSTGAVAGPGPATGGQSHGQRGHHAASAKPAAALCFRVHAKVPRLLQQ